MQNIALPISKANKKVAVFILLFLGFIVSNSLQAAVKKVDSGSFQQQSSTKEQVTRDDSSNIDLYYSDSSYQTVNNTFDGKGNYDLLDTLNPINILAGIGKSTATGINQIEDAFIDGATLNGIVSDYDNRDDKGIINTKNAEKIGKNIEAGIKATTAGLYSYTTKEGEKRKIGDDTSYTERFEALRNGTNLNDLMRQDSVNVDRTNNATDETVKGLQNVIQTLNNQAGNQDKTAIVFNNDTFNQDAANAKGLSTETQIGINTDNTDISNVRDLVATVGHENSNFDQHQNGNTGEALTTLVGIETGYQWVNQNRIEGRQTGGQSGVSVEEWRAQNKNSSTFTKNNATVDAIKPTSAEFRAFEKTEASVLDQARKSINQTRGLTVAEKQIALVQLDALACAEVQCAKGVPDTDKYYETLSKLQTLGDELKAQGMNLNDIIGEKTDVLFEYDTADSINDFIGRHDEAMQRTGGAVQTACGNSWWYNTDCGRLCHLRSHTWCGLCCGNRGRSTLNSIRRIRSCKWHTKHL